MRLLFLTMALAQIVLCDSSEEVSRPSDPNKAVVTLEQAGRLLEHYRLTRLPETLEEAKKLIAEAKAAGPSQLLARKMDAFVLLLEGEYEGALEAAGEVNRKIPDDLEVYGYLVDALLALGRLEDAEKQATWMLRLRPENRETLRRVVEWRRAFGDKEGARLALEDLWRATQAMETLERAWVLAMMARLTPDTAKAEALVHKALELAPDSFEARQVLETLKGKAK